MFCVMSFGEVFGKSAGSVLHEACEADGIVQGTYLKGGFDLWRNFARIAGHR